MADEAKRLGAVRDKKVPEPVAVGGGGAGDGGGTSGGGGSSGSGGEGGGATPPPRSDDAIGPDGSRRSLSRMVKPLDRETIEALKATGLDDAGIARHLELMGDIYVFRGTTLGHPGNPVLQDFKVTPVSIDPLVATVFAAESRSRGANPVVHVASYRRLEVPFRRGNTRIPLEREVAVPMLPSVFEQRAMRTIPLDKARQILHDLGFDVPPTFARVEDATAWLRTNQRRMTPEEIRTFLERVGS